MSGKLTLNEYKHNNSNKAFAYLFAVVWKGRLSEKSDPRGPLIAEKCPVYTIQGNHP